MYQSDDSWLVVDLVNHQPILIDIRDAADSNKSVAVVDTSSDEIHLERTNSMNSAQVLPKVHILLGGQQGDYNLAQRGEKKLRVKTLAQQWLDELSALLKAGNLPFSIMYNNALASIVNHGFSAYQYPSINALVDRPNTNCNQSVAALFYQLLLLLDNTDFIIAKQRMGDLSANDSEGAIPDSKLLRQAINSVSNLRHSEGYHYAYTNNE